MRRRHSLSVSGERFLRVIFEQECDIRVRVGEQIK
jgi:hypothetical protein